MRDSSQPFTNPVSEYIWRNKYRFTGLDDSEPDTNISDTWKRVARSLAAIERRDRELWEDRFYEILQDFKFLPGGRILAGAGTQRNVTLFNCFVMGEIEDSIDGIFHALREGALTMQQGGGVGYDFSSLRPAGTPARRVGSVASGPVSFMHVWNSMCATLLSTGQRRGAMMATLRCDHPDIEDFINAKSDENVLTHFNLSVLVTDDFMHSVMEDADWQLIFPVGNKETELQNDDIVLRRISSQAQQTRCRVYRTISARELWDKIVRASYEYSEPGVLFIDRINRENNLGDLEVIHATNPCGEIPLPAYGACNLGSVNLPLFVRRPFKDQSKIDFEAIGKTVAVGTRMLDNVIDVSRYPLDQQHHTVLQARRIGLGVTGLADALAMLGLKYGSPESFDVVETTMRTIRDCAYRTSVELAREKGAFPLFNAANFLDRPFVRRMPDSIRAEIAQYGIRNSHLLAIAPAGTISLLANNVSSGIEPIYALKQSRKFRRENDNYDEFEVKDYAFDIYKSSGDLNLPTDVFSTSENLSANEHLGMQTVVQTYVDNAISKTINLPEDIELKECAWIFFKAYESGLKGCTIYRPNPIRGQVLRSSEYVNHSRCCVAE